MKKIWYCKIGEVEGDVLPYDADSPPRRAVIDVYTTLTGRQPEFCFSGWGGELTEPERACVENRPPRDEKPAPCRVRCTNYGFMGYVCCGQAGHDLHYITRGDSGPWGNVIVHTWRV